MIESKDANEYGGVPLPPKIECHFPLKEEYAELFDEEKESKAEYYEDLCRRADYYGMESLTEEEQYLLLHRPLVD